MAYEQKDNSGSVFKNERKEKDTHPDRTGSAMIDGVAYWVSGWVKQDRNGNPFLSLAFKRKEAAPQRVPAARTDGRTVTSRRDELNDEVPF
jgi:hypothetical protein